MLDWRRNSPTTEIERGSMNHFPPPQFNPSDKIEAASSSSRWRLNKKLFIIPIVFALLMYGMFLDDQYEKSSETKKSDKRSTTFKMFNSDIKYRYLDDLCLNNILCVKISISSKKGCATRLFAELTLLDDAGVIIGTESDFVGKTLPNEEVILTFDTSFQTATTSLRTVVCL